MRKVTMTVFCFVEDAEAVSKSLYAGDVSVTDDWFSHSPASITGISVAVTEPTEEEDRLAFRRLGDEYGE